MKTCTVEGCARKHAANGLCLMHYKRFRKYGTTELPEREIKLCLYCSRQAVTKGMCDAHRQMDARHGDPLHADKKRAALEPLYVDKQGYLAVRGKGGHNVHRIITNAKPGQVVHHIDDDKLNNDLSNLYICENQAKHASAHQSIEKLGFELVKVGLINFDRSLGRYVFSPQAIELLEQLQHSLTDDT